MAGKTGVNAIFVALRGVCHTVGRYRSKLDAAIDAAVTGGAITSAQGTAARDFLAAATALCSVFELISTFINPT